MSDQQEPETVVLTELDIPGAALNGKDPKLASKSDLKFWLQCRGVKVSKIKTKAEHIKKYTIYSISLI